MTVCLSEGIDMTQTQWPKCVLCRSPIMEEGTNNSTQYHRSCHRILRPIYKRLYSRHYNAYGRPYPNELDTISNRALELARQEYAEREIDKLSESQ